MAYKNIYRVDFGAESETTEFLDTAERLYSELLKDAVDLGGTVRLVELSLDGHNRIIGAQTIMQSSAPGDQLDN